MVRDSFDESKEPKINAISHIFSVLFLGVSIYFVVRMIMSNILPAKYFFPAILVLIILNFLIFLISFKRRTSRATIIVYDIVYTIISILLVGSQLKFDGAENNLNNNSEDGNKQFAIYQVIVSSKSNISSMEELEGKELFTYEEPAKEVSNDELENAVKNVVDDSSLVFKNDLDIVLNRAVRLIDSGSVIKNTTLESYIAANQDYFKQIHTIGEIKVEIKETENK